MVFTPRILPIRERRLVVPFRFNWRSVRADLKQFVRALTERHFGMNQAIDVAIPPLRVHCEKRCKRTWSLKSCMFSMLCRRRNWRTECSGFESILSLEGECRLRSKQICNVSKALSIIPGHSWTAFGPKTLTLFQSGMSWTGIHMFPEFDQAI